MRAALLSGFPSNQNYLEIRRSGGRNNVRFNSHCREQSGVGFSSMGPLPRRPWSAFSNKESFKRTHDRKDSGRSIEIVVETSIIGKDAALASPHFLVISLKQTITLSTNVRTVSPLARYQHCAQPELGRRAVEQMGQEQELAARRIASTRRLL